MAYTKYIWDPLSDNVLMEKDENGATQATNTYLPELYGDLISQRRDGETSYYHFDGQGSTRALTDENEDVTDTYTYTAFGEEVSKTGTTENPYRYVGEKGYYLDGETGDYYVRARSYGPMVARWLSVDPFGFVDGMNVFVYAGNDSTNLIDASGLRGDVPALVPLFNLWGVDLNVPNCVYDVMDPCRKRNCWTPAMCEGCVECKCTDVDVNVTEDYLNKLVEVIKMDPCCRTACNVKVKVGDCMKGAGTNSWSCVGMGAPSKRTIYICINVALSSCDRVSTLYHEMVHAKQLCEMAVPCFDRRNCRDLEFEAWKVDCEIQLMHECKKPGRVEIGRCAVRGRDASCARVATGEIPCDFLEHVFGKAPKEHPDVRVDRLTGRCKGVPSK